MNACNMNRVTDFNLNVKQAEDDNGASNLLKLFDQKNPEGVYSLDLSLIYDRIVLGDLLTVSE